MRTRLSFSVLSLACIVASFAFFCHQSQPPQTELAPEQTKELEESSQTVTNELLPSPQTEASVDSNQDSDPIRQSFKSALKDMQKADELATASASALHHTPEVTLAAARRLGEIVALEAKQASRQSEFLAFYRNCAEDQLVITVTRAQCAKEYLRASQVDQDAAKSWLQDLPEAVQRIHSILEP